MGLEMRLYRIGEDGTNVEVAYWRKAYAIHAWFLFTFEMRRSFTFAAEDLARLVMTCDYVLNTCATTPAYTCTKTFVKPDQTMVRWFELGRRITEPDVAARYVPDVCSPPDGYEEHYLRQLENTVVMLAPLLELDAQFEYRWLD